MRRRTIFLLAGLVLLLVSGGGWLAHRADPAAAAQDGPSTLAAPEPSAQRAQAGSDTPPASSAAAGPGAEPAAPVAARCSSAWDRIERRRIAQLAAEPDADSQLAAALLDFAPVVDARGIEAMNLRRQRRLQWALELAPDDPLVVTHAHRFCAGVDGCDASRTLAQLERVDPDNAWTWIAVLQRAQAAGDAAGVERALERLAGSRAARSYHGQTALRVLDRFGEPRLPDGCAARLLAGMEVGGPATSSNWIDAAVGVKVLAALPSMWPVMQACPADAGDARLRALCIRGLARLAGAETLFEQSIATARLVQLTAGTADGAAWRERYRNLLWLQAQVHARRLSPSGALMAWWERGEVRFYEQRLKVMDAWPAPPGWLPEDEAHRTLVLTGRLPPPR